MSPKDANQMRELRLEIERLRKLHDQTIKMARRLLAERDKGYAVALQLADWAAYWRSAHADEETLSELRQMKRKLEQG